MGSLAKNTVEFYKHWDFEYGISLKANISKEEMDNLISKVEEIVEKEKLYKKEV